MKDRIIFLERCIRRIERAQTLDEVRAWCDDALQNAGARNLCDSPSLVMTVLFLWFLFGIAIGLVL